jgi:hypothetical protein
MDILLSFCNVTIPGRPALGLLDLDTSRFRVLQLPAELPQPVSVTGLSASPHYLYAALQRPRSAPSELAVFDRCRLSLVNHYRCRSAVDVHSLWVSGETLYAASSGTDEVLALRMRGPHVQEEAVFWRPDPRGTRIDTYHVNGLCEWGGDLLVSGHGRKTGARWSSADSGFIFNISRGERVASNIYHPHSPADLGHTLAYCESSRMMVRFLEDGRCLRLPGYTRGLCRVGNELFVGTSVGRQVSRSTGLINNPTEEGVPQGQCSIVRLSAEDLTATQTIDLGAYATEIYDLLAVEGTNAWPTATVSNNSLMDLTDELAALIPRGCAFILIDDNQGDTGEVLAGRRRVPFLERDGQYWGNPENEIAATAELERLRTAGVAFLAIAWPAFWWLDYYARWHRHLRSSFHRILENDRLVVFDLRSPACAYGDRETHRIM